jgi:hypothetical protein
MCAYVQDIFLVCESVFSFSVSVNGLSGHKKEINVSKTSFYHTIFSFCSNGKVTKEPSFKVIKEKCELGFGKQTKAKHTTEMLGKKFQETGRI